MFRFFDDKYNKLRVTFGGDWEWLADWLALLVEDEFHFIMKCKLYDVLRDQLFHEMSDIYNISTFDINSLSNDDIFKMIMSANDYDTWKIITCFVNSCFTTRSSSSTTV